MKTLAIHIQTTNNPDLSIDQDQLVKSHTMDRRLKKAEAIKAYLESNEYHLKKTAFQMRRAEFGIIHQLTTFDGRDTDQALDEERSLHLLNIIVKGVDRLIVFDADFTLRFILKRAMLTGFGLDLRDKIYSPNGTAATSVIDIKRMWAGSNKEYSSMGLTELGKYLNMDTPGTEAEAVYEIYQKMRGYLCS